MEKTAPKQLSITKQKEITIQILGAFAHRDLVYLYYRSNTDNPNTFHLATSPDGFSFGRIEKNLSIKTGVINKETVTKCTFCSILQYHRDYLLLYSHPGKTKHSLRKAWSRDLLSWEYEGEVLGCEHSGKIIPQYVYKAKYVMYGGIGSIAACASRDLISWEKMGEAILEPRNGMFDSGELEIEDVFPTVKGIVVIYHAKQNARYTVGVALFDKINPTKLLWRSSQPLWVQPKEWQGKVIYPIGAVTIKGNITAYWQVENEGIYAVLYGLHQISDGHIANDVSLQLERVEHNPLISPKSENAWEAFNTFNPAAVYDEGKVHLLYRAQGFDYISVIGYATSSDGVHIDQRFDQPIYTPSYSFENPFGKATKQQFSYHFFSAGYGGCEDPRITKIDDRFYLTYVAFDGYNPPRVALTSIAADDFRKQRWLWERPVLISPPGIVDKSAVIFPEKINGKYVIMHRIYPDILIDFVDNLNFDGTYWLKGQYKISPRADKWDSRKIGAGAPPIKTKDGWLLIYQSVGEQDPGRYKIGAMLLDLDDPTKVLYRSQSPILEPNISYENEGFKAGVIYPCGAVVIGNTLYVYYGGADSYVCVATANLDEFLAELKHSEVTRMKEPVMRRIW